MRSLRNQSILLSGLSLINLALTLGSNVVVAAMFGASREMDTYVVAFSIPTFVMAIGSGLLNSCLVPILSDFKANSPAAAERVAFGMAAIGFIIFSFLALAIMFLAKPLFYLLASGFSPEQLIMGSRLLTLLGLLLPFYIWSEVLTALLYTQGKSTVPFLIRLLHPFILILFVNLFASQIDVASLAYGNLAAFATQALLLTFFSWPEQPSTFWKWDPSVLNAVTRFFVVAAPLLLTMPLYQALPVFDRWASAQLATGSATVLNYANRLFQILPAILVSGLAASFFPVMAGFAAKRELGSLSVLLQKCLRMLLFVSIPLAAILGILCKPWLVFFFARGAFSVEATSELHHVLTIYLLGLPAVLIGAIISNGLFSLKMTRVVAVAGVLEALFYVTFCLATLQIIGILALPIGSVIYLYSSSIILLLILSKKLSDGMILSVLRYFGGRILAVLAAFSPVAPLLFLLPASPLTSSLEIGIVLLLYFFFSIKIQKTQEAAQLSDILKSRFRRYATRK